MPVALETFALPLDLLRRRMGPMIAPADIVHPEHEVHMGRLKPEKMLVAVESGDLRGGARVPRVIDPDIFPRVFIKRILTSPTSRSSRMS